MDTTGPIQFGSNPNHFDPALRVEALDDGLKKTRLAFLAGSSYDHCLILRDKVLHFITPVADSHLAIGVLGIDRLKVSSHTDHCVFGS
jgi:hypothetical protein